MLEQLLMSLKVIVIGLGTVFVALIALICVIELMNKALNAGQHHNNIEKTDREKNLEKVDIVTANSAGGNENEVIQKETDEEEIVAVIAAAIAASLNRSTHDIVVRSIKRVPYNTPAWNRAGRNQQIAERL